jgi:2-dehydropantoate 2-reductase
MRFVVYGAGAIGGVVGGRLAQAGHEVVLIARGAHHDAIRDEGLRLVTPDTVAPGTVTLDTEPVALSIPVVSHPAGIDFRDDDVVLMAMKSQHTGKALSTLLAHAPDTVSVVCMQNGVANEPAALRLFEDVYGVCVVCPALHLEPGVVEAHASPVSGILDIGRYPRGVGPLGEKIAAAFASATFESVARPDIMRWKYGKLLNNLGNAVDALCGPDPGARVVHRRAWREGTAVIEAAGIDAVGPDEDAKRRGEGFQWGGAAASSRPGASSWQSLARGTGSIEADYLNGEIVLLGRQHDVPTPVNHLLQRLATAAAREGRRPGSLPVDELLEMLPPDE